MRKDTQETVYTFSNKISVHQVRTFQGSKGIRRWQMNWCTFPMMIHKNYLICILQLVVGTFGHLTKWTNQSKFNNTPTRLLTQWIRKTIVINSPMSPISLTNFVHNVFCYYNKNEGKSKGKGVGVLFHI